MGTRGRSYIDAPRLLTGPALECMLSNPPPSLPHPTLPPSHTSSHVQQEVTDKLLAMEQEQARVQVEVQAAKADMQVGGSARQAACVHMVA